MQNGVLIFISLLERFKTITGMADIYKGKICTESMTLWPLQMTAQNKNKYFIKCSPSLDSKLILKTWI